MKLLLITTIFVGVITTIVDTHSIYESQNQRTLIPIVFSSGSSSQNCCSALSDKIDNTCVDKNKYQLNQQKNQKKIQDLQAKIRQITDSYKNLTQNFKDLVKKNEEFKTQQSAQIQKLKDSLTTPKPVKQISQKNTIQQDTKYFRIKGNKNYIRNQIPASGSWTWSTAAANQEQGSLYLLKNKKLYFQNEDYWILPNTFVSDSNPQPAWVGHVGYMNAHSQSYYGDMAIQYSCPETNKFRIKCTQLLKNGTICVSYLADRNPNGYAFNFVIDSIHQGQKQSNKGNDYCFEKN